MPLVALAGNPNTGKTSVFNHLTGSRARVGNYPGVTVERRSARMDLGGGRQAELVDIPGTYSLVGRSAEEQLAIAAMLGLNGNPRPDLVVLCVDATQLLRNLYLVLQAQELGLNLVLALTMMDEAREVLPEPEALGRLLQCSVAPVVGRTGEGLDALRDLVRDRLDHPDTQERWRWRPSEGLGHTLRQLREAWPPEWPAQDALALWALMSVEPGDELVGVPEALRAAVLALPLDRAAVDDEAITGRYRWLDAEVAPLIARPASRAWTERADAVLIHPVWGFAVFLGIMLVLFQSLFAWADPAITLIEDAFAALSSGVQAVVPPGLVADFLTHAVLGGVGSVLVFLPQILLLFFLLGLLEDSGYLARVAYLMDRIMRLMRLNGRAFVPMLSGFACAIPAILATRTMERRRDRLLTMMVVPLMTCSARLPVYTLIIGSLFPAGVVLGVLPVQGLLMVGLYVFSVIMALGAAWVMSRTVLKAPPVPLVLELPPYRLPRLHDVLRAMGSRASSFLREAGTVIFGFTVVLWVLLSFPRAPEPPGGGLEPAPIAVEQVEAAAQAEAAWAGEQVRNSLGGRLGRALEPVIAPLGMDWKIGVALIGAFAAREVFVSTLGVVYGVGGDVNEESTTLRERMAAEVRADGRPVYTPLTGMSILVFFALACQCMSTVAVVRRETGGWAWPGFLVAYMSALAWTASFIVYQGGRLLGLE